MEEHASDRLTLSVPPGMDKYVSRQSFLPLKEC